MNEMAKLSPFPTVITLKISGLKVPIKRHRFAE